MFVYPLRPHDTDVGGGIGRGGLSYGRRQEGGQDGTRAQLLQDQRLLLQVLQLGVAPAVVMGDKTAPTPGKVVVEQPTSPAAAAAAIVSAAAALPKAVD